MAEWRPPDPGRLRDLITIEQPVEVANAYGEPVQTWTAFGKPNLYAFLTPAGGQEMWQAQQVRPEVTQAVVMRWLPGVTPKFRLNLQGRVLHIIYVYDPQGGRGEWMVLECKEQV